MKRYWKLIPPGALLLVLVGCAGTEPTTPGSVHQETARQLEGGKGPGSAIPPEETHQ